MAYVPQNISVFSAAFAGALAGMAVGGRATGQSTFNFNTGRPIVPAPVDYKFTTDTIGAFAEAFDTVWGATPPTVLELTIIQEMCEAAWIGKCSPIVKPTDPAAFIDAQKLSDPANYINEVTALIAIVTAGDAYFAAQGIVPPLPGGAFWPYGSPIPANIVAPGFAQVSPNPTGAGQNILSRTQSAKVGSDTRAGEWQYVLGMSDGAAAPNETFYIAAANVEGGLPHTVDVTQLMSVERHAGGVAAIRLAGGTNDIGGGMAGAQVASVVELSIASHTAVNVGTINGADIAILFVQNITDNGTAPGFDGTGLNWSYATRMVGVADDSGFRIVKQAGSVSTAQSRSLEYFEGAVRQYAFEASSAPAGYSNLVFYDATGLLKPVAGFVRVPFRVVFGNTAYLTSLDLAGVADRNLVSRQFDAPTFGNFTEDSQCAMAGSWKFQALGAGLGLRFFSASSGFTFACRSDAFYTVVYGDPDEAGVIKDGQIKTQVAVATASNGANQVLRTITLQDESATTTVGTLTTQVSIVQGRDEVTGDYVAFRISQSFIKVGGAVTASALATVITPLGNTAAAAATAATATLTANAGTSVLKVTPWTNNRISWNTITEENVLKQIV